MTDTATDPREILKAKLNGETARLSWRELERHFARGVVVRVAEGLDLVEVAVAFARDEKAPVRAWMRAGQVAPASTGEALRWHAGNAMLWAVVAAPWVLVQEERFNEPSPES